MCDHLPHRGLAEPASATQPPRRPPARTARTPSAFRSRTPQSGLYGCDNAPTFWVRCHFSRGSRVLPGVRVPPAPYAGLGVCAPRAAVPGAVAGRPFIPFAAYRRGLSWLIRASWLIRGIPVHPIHRGARIHRGNRRTPPPGVAVAGPVAAVTSRGGGGAITRSPWLDG